MNIKQTYNLGELSLVPNMSMITSRTQCNPKIDYNGAEKYPVMVAPMDTVLDAENYEVFEDAGYLTVLPRNKWREIDYKNKEYKSFPFISLSLNQVKEIINEIESDFSIEFENLAKHITDNGHPLKIHIDVANGHMSNMLKFCRVFRQVQEVNKGRNLEIMAGNVANPEAIKFYDAHKIDYIKLGIGGGSACLTSAKTPIHYPMASLIAETAEIKRNNGLKVKIIADGGIRNNRDIVMCLALGADFVMSGKLFNQCEEACSDVYYWHKGEYTTDNSIMITDYDRGFMPNMNSFSHDMVYYQKSITYTQKYHLYRGMSTTEVQKDQQKENIRVSEGKSSYNEVLWTLAEFTKELDHSIRSTLSYIGFDAVTDFIEQSKTIKKIYNNNFQHNKI